MTTSPEFRDLAGELRADRRYMVELTSGGTKRVENRNDAIERVADGTALSWWWQEHFESYQIERHPEFFVGKKVNLAGKGGGLWEETTIEDYRQGKLRLAGGFFIRNTFETPPERRSIGERHSSVYPFDIARGFVWGGPE